jgi:hypothetical protein
MSKLSRFVAELAVLLVAFAVGGAVIGIIFTYQSRLEDLSVPSRLVTVVGVWDGTEGEVCRAFSYRDVRPDTLPVRFDLSAADIETCRQAFAAYDPKQGWPRKLRADEPGYEGYAFEVEKTSPLEIRVHRATQDPANWAETQYRVDADGRISHVSTKSASEGQGIGVVFGALLGIIAWFFVAALQFLRLLAGRKA